MRERLVRRNSWRFTLGFATYFVERRTAAEGCVRWQRRCGRSGRSMTFASPTASDVTSQVDCVVNGQHVYKGGVGTVGTKVAFQVGVMRRPRNESGAAGYRLCATRCCSNPMHTSICSVLSGCGGVAPQFRRIAPASACSSSVRSSSPAKIRRLEAVPGRGRERHKRRRRRRFSHAWRMDVAWRADPEQRAGVMSYGSYRQLPPNF